MNNRHFVPQSNTKKNDDPKVFLQQQKQVVNMLNDLRQQGSDRITLKQYQKRNGIKRVFGYE